MKVEKGINQVSTTEKMSLNVISRWQKGKIKEKETKQDSPV
jgi:hypothetical protein